ncbi:hypothetical protein HDV05_004626 [Chytridiales sp. JEL 0842]|nr:hypothetical protein HDV05_004626 [Chytridiales sp. JEL 0842]
MAADPSDTPEGWLPLPTPPSHQFAWHAVVLCPFSPTSSSLGPQMGASGGGEASTMGSTSSLATTPRLDLFLPLEIGDTVHLLEEYIVNPPSDPSAERKPKWFRGYIFRASSAPQTSTSNVQLGVFPAEYVYCRSLSAYRKTMQVKKGVPSNEALPIRSEEKAQEDVGESLSAQLETMGLQSGDDGIVGRHNTVVNPPAGLVKDPASAKRTSRPRSGTHLSTALLTATTPSNPTHPPIPTSVRPTHDTASGSKEPLADEISSTLREWGPLLKSYLLNRNYTLFNTTKDLFNSLYQGRRQLLSQTLSQEELVKLRRSLVAKMDMGNRMQGLDVVIRHPERGHLVGERSSSVVKALRMHMEIGASGPSVEEAAGKPPRDNASGGIGGLTFMSGQPPSASFAKDTLLNPTPSDLSKICTLQFELTACTASICLPGEYTELAFFIYNKQESKIVSEEFLVIIDYNGNPRGAEDGGKARLKTLFTDLGSRDLCEQTILVCRIVRVGKMNVSDKEGSGTVGSASSLVSPGSSSGSLNEGVGGYRRPFGCAILELGEVWNASVSTNSAAPLNSPVSVTSASILGRTGGEGVLAPREYVMKIYVPSNEANFPTLYELIANKLSGYEVSTRADQLKVELAVCGIPPPPILEPERLIVERTPRLGYPDIIYPGDARNSIYLTFVNGEFSGRATTLSARNVQVSVQVRLNDGSFVDNCILRGLGQFESAYESIVYYHTNSPRWMETIRLDLDPTTFERAHLFFVFRHCSSSASFNSATSGGDRDKNFFAFAFMPLLRNDHTVINDAAHTLTLYKFDRRFAHPSVYLSYQAGPNIIGPSSTLSQESLTVAAEALSKAPQLKDVFVLRTLFCSTLMTQSSAILNVLHWRHATTHLRMSLESILKEFRYVPDLEVVKFLHGILGNLFDMMDTVGRDSMLGDQLFQALVFVLSVVTDRRFSAYAVVIDTYIDKWFQSVKCWQIILDSFGRLLLDPVEKSVRDAIKVWGYWIRFVVRSGLVDQRSQTSDATEGDGGGALFSLAFGKILNSLENLMSLTLPEAIATQTLALQHFPQLLPDLARLYGPVDLVTVIVRFADSIRGSKAKLNAQKLAFIHTLIRGPLFADRRSRFVLVSATARWISECLNGDWDKDHTTPSSSAMSPIQKVSQTMIRENLRLCLNLTAELVDRLQKVGDRLERGKQEGAKNGTRDAQVDSKTREEDFKRCLEAVSLLVPLLLRTYSAILNPARLPYGLGSLSTLGNSTSGSYDDFSADISLVAAGSLSVNTNVSLASSTFSPSGGLTSPILQQPQVMRPSATVSRASTSIYAPRSFELAELGATIIALLHLLPSSMLRHIFSDSQMLSTTNEGVSVITSLFVVLQSMIRGDAFPSFWVAANFLVSRMAVKALRAVSDVLKSDSTSETADNQSSSFPASPRRASQGSVSMAGSAGGTSLLSTRKWQSLWADFFGILLQLLNARWLSIESFPPQCARAAHRLHADMRGDAGDLLRSMWESLTAWEKQFKAQMTFIPNLVGPFLELTMSPHPRLREAAVELLFSTFVREQRASGNYSRIEHECIDRIDRLITVEGRASDSYRRFFVEALGKRFTMAARDSVVAVTASVDGSMIQGRPLSNAGEDVAAATTLAAFGARFLPILDSFLEMTITLYELPVNDRFDDERIWTTLRILKFLRESGRRGLYVKYIHNLARLHLNHGNHLEAALTIKLHADLLMWSHDHQLEAMSEYGFNKWQTAFERKEQIYLQCIEYLDRSKYWERALILCNELSKEYQKDWLDYKKYGNILKSQARFAEAIVDKERYHPSYYRVGFYGKGFPSSLRGKQFIYRGGEWEKLGPFCERILNKYVGAQLLRTNAPVSEDVMNGPGSWVQITAVNPEIDVNKWSTIPSPESLIHWDVIPEETLAPSVTSPFSSLISPRGSIPGSVQQEISSSQQQQQTLWDQRQSFIEPDLDPNPESLHVKAVSVMDKLPESIKSYYLSNEVHLFSFSRPFRRPDPTISKDNPAKEFLELWTEKTVFMTADTFPHLCNRSQVVKTSTAELSPIENAIISVRTKNRQLKALEKKYEIVARSVMSESGNRVVSSTADSGGSSRRDSASGALTGSPELARNINLFTMALNGAVDAPVNGGVPMYRGAFLSEAFRAANPEKGQLVDMLQKAIEVQVKIIYSCLLIHEVIVPAQLKPLHDTLLNFFQKNFQNEITKLGLRNIKYSKFIAKDSSGSSMTRPPRRDSGSGTLNTLLSIASTVFGTESTSTTAEGAAAPSSGSKRLSMTSVKSNGSAGSGGGGGNERASGGGGSLSGGAAGKPPGIQKLFEKWNKE